MENKHNIINSRTPTGKDKRMHEKVFTEFDTPALGVTALIFKGMVREDYGRMVVWVGTVEYYLLWPQ
jgi:hypothetical protein